MRDEVCWQIGQHPWEVVDCAFKIITSGSIITSAISITSFQARIDNIFIYYQCRSARKNCGCTKFEEEPDTPIVSRFQGRDVAGGKLLSTDAGTRVPLIAKWPGVIKPGTTNSDLIDFTDLMPTMLEAGTIQVPDSLDIDGVSFLPQLKGNLGTPRKWIYSWYLNPMKDQPRVFARNHRFKLYESGEFYDMPSDYLEERPIAFDALDDNSQTVYLELQQVLADHAKRRLDAIRNDRQLSSKFLD